MCATTDLPVKAATADKAKTDDGASPASPPSPSSYLTPISIKQRIDNNLDASDGALFHRDSSSNSSARVRLHQRRPSVVQSDYEGNDEDDDDGSHDSDGFGQNDFCSQMVLFPAAVCQGDQLDIFMACRHPLEMLGMQPTEEETVALSEHAHTTVTSTDRTESSTNANTNHGNKVSGYHAIPTDCEYCGSPDIANCHTDCQRPHSFFPRQRPPFCPRGTAEWDEQDFAIREQNHTDQLQNGAYARADKQC
ncbi:hypothetical protein IV203_008622 [Nitzschia inconspicua]|uniref:Uncharacterized protein n=1 Tax=Nitzschia inconspicua TaxID=303405 RepID=A0A9K3PPK2_9STRA|nr:hypothetical protein IV203_008622 [Nitzschia inconspicua]